MPDFSLVISAANFIRSTFSPNILGHRMITASVWATVADLMSATALPVRQNDPPLVEGGNLYSATQRGQLR